MDVYTGHPAYMAIANFVNIDVILPMHQNVGETRNAPQYIVNIKDEHFSYHYNAKSTQLDSSVNDIHYKHNPFYLY